MSSSQLAAPNDDDYEAHVLLLSQREKRDVFWTGTTKRDDVPYNELTSSVRAQLSSLRTLGTGSHGEVQLVVIDGIPMARKDVRPSSRRTFESLKSEVHALHKLADHRHIVKLVGSYTTSDSVYLENDSLQILTFPVADCDLDTFMSSIEGLGPSPRPMRATERLPPFKSSSLYTAAGLLWPPERHGSEFLDLGTFLKQTMGCLTQALSWIHHNKIAHDDLKPANVLLRRGRLYITDFGISRDRCDAQNTSTETYPGMTRGYCAPEKAAAGEHNPFQSDIYSLGCIFIHIISVISGKKTREECSATLESWAKEREKKIEDYLRPFNPSFLERVRSWIWLPRDATSTTQPFAKVVKLITDMLLNERQARPIVASINEELLRIGGEYMSYHCRCCWTTSNLVADHTGSEDIMVIRKERDQSCDLPSGSDNKMRTRESQPDSARPSHPNDSTAAGERAESPDLPDWNVMLEGDGTSNISNTFGRSGTLLKRKSSQRDEGAQEGPAQRRKMDASPSSIVTKNSAQVWTCCNCADSGMTTNIPGCSSCQHARCGYCATYKVSYRY